MPDDALDPRTVTADYHRVVGPGSLDETHTVVLGGVPQVVTIRGRRPDLPVLVLVHGGPGSPLSGTSWMWQRPVEEYFTVVHHDQRGAGRSHALTDPEQVRPTLTIDRFVDDLVELLEWLTDHLGVAEVALLGHSWGSVVATRATLARPDLVSVYVGVGQVVSMPEGERASWRWARRQAEAVGDDEAAAGLDDLLPYPGDRDTFVEKLYAERRWVQRLGGFAAHRDHGDYYGRGYVLAPDHSDAEIESADAGNRFSADAVASRLLDVDLGDVTSFPVPMVQVLGRHDRMTPPELVGPWLDAMDVSCVVEWFEHSAHLAMYEEPGHFLLTLLEHVRPHTA
ncbi:alpha/beta fold hydrolase [Solicola sp. PLA-1-18]|uniref:alpha/beta fold hydrolase n=1 Tax=Solicola sp. PLA-1-18 TaxID=3380532 RepID=UPI003B817491